MKLFRKSFNGKIQFWAIEKIDTNCIITFGQIGGIEQTMRCPIKEYDSRIRSKRMEGYKSLEDLKVNSMLYLYNLPDSVWTSNDSSILPMKCTPFSPRKMAYPCLAQPKLNGLRAVMRLEETVIGVGLFAETEKEVVLRSKEGLKYHLPHITKSIPHDKFTHNGIDLIFDGELYRHGWKLNIIKSAIPYYNQHGTLSKPSSNPLEISFNVFDLSIDNFSQNDRIHMLGHALSLCTSKHIDIVKNALVNNDKEAEQFRNLCLQQGYEGCVLRPLDKEYAFGRRPTWIMKYKKWQDAEFVCIDIVPASENDGVTGCKFIFKNDINDHTFESMPTGWSKEEQEQALQHKEELIGKEFTVRFYERSGVIDAPFHSNVLVKRDIK